MSKSLLRKSFVQSMLKATRLTDKGSLMDATRLIQRTLTGLAASPASSAPTAPSPLSPAHDRHHSGPVAQTVDVTDVQPKSVSPFMVTPSTSASNRQDDMQSTSKESLTPNFVLIPSPQDASPLAEASPAPVVAPTAPVHRPGTFTESTFLFKNEKYAYRLYIPASLRASSAAAAPAGPKLLPLVVLLHGCKQNALDFAKGTGMNALADQQQVVVLYPEQLPKANSGGCWNWFEPSHQTRNGEPGMIAALTCQVLAASHNGVQIDPDRVYIAGLSAGGAMSAVVGELYPDVFAAVGVHSGLPAGAAQSMVGAFSAMRRGGPVQTATAMPTIVFHGSADTTVHPDNGTYTSDAARTALASNGLELVKTEQTMRTQGLRPAQRVSYLDNSGKPFVEHWTVSDAGHAWSGGNAAGSYTDPQGPSASSAMLAFFLQHEKRKPN